MPNSAKKLIEQLERDPELFPDRLLVPYNQAGFCRMDEESYRSSPFLDHRMKCLEQDSARIGFSEIGPASKRLQPQATHFIFHNAFTCSTLLTRYFDAFGELLVLREPNILYEIATLHRFAGTPILRPLQGVQWEELYRFVMLLLTRRFPHNRAVIIKPSDGCNNLMAALTAFHPDNRALFIYSPLERFLASVLRHPPRHEWVRIRVRELLLDRQRATGTRPVNPETLTIWQAAAMTWLLHTELYLEAAQTEQADRYRSLEADRFLESPTMVLQALARYFSLNLAPETIAHAVAQAETGRHAKASHETYDRQQREEDFTVARAQFGREIDQAHEWVRAFAGDRDIRAPLPKSLCAG